MSELTPVLDLIKDIASVLMFHLSLIAVFIIIYIYKA